MGSIIESLNKLIAEPFPKKYRTIVMSTIDMETLKCEFSFFGGKDVSTIRMFNGVNLYVSELCPVGKMYLMGTDETEEWLKTPLVLP